MTDHHFTLQVSNHHPGAAEPAPHEHLWQTLYDGPLGPSEARATCEALGAWFRHIRAFRGRALGRLWFERSAA